MLLLADKTPDVTPDVTMAPITEDRRAPRAGSAGEDATSPRERAPIAAKSQQVDFERGMAPTEAMAPRGEARWRGKEGLGAPLRVLLIEVPLCIFFYVRYLYSMHM